MKSLTEKSVFTTALGLSVLACDGSNQQSKCMVYAAGTAQNAALGASQAASTSAILVSEQPDFHFVLGQYGGIASPSGPQSAPTFNITVNPGALSLPSRDVQVDLVFDGSQAPPLSQLQIAWNSTSIYSYDLISYETRVSPSSNPGLTLLFEVVENPSGLSADPTSPFVLGTLSAWIQEDDSLVQQGSAQNLVDPWPFQQQPVYIPTLPGDVFPPCDPN